MQNDFAGCFAVEGYPDADVEQTHRRISIPVVFRVRRESGAGAGLAAACVLGDRMGDAAALLL